MYELFSRYFTSISIEDHWNRSVETNDEDLIAMWKLDEGTGGFCIHFLYDNVGEH